MSKWIDVAPETKHIDFSDMAASKTIFFTRLILSHDFVTLSF